MRILGSLRAVLGAIYRRAAGVATVTDPRIVTATAWSNRLTDASAWSVRQQAATAWANTVVAATAEDGE